MKDINNAAVTNPRKTETYQTRTITKVSQRVQPWTLLTSKKTVNTGDWLNDKRPVCLEDG